MKILTRIIGIDTELFWSGVEWSGPAIRPGLDTRHLIIEGDKRSWKVKEGQGRSWMVFSHH